MKKIIYIIIVVAFIVTACDRFKHSYNEVVSQTEDEFIQYFEEQTSLNLRENNINTVLEYYSDTYLNNGLTKSGISSFYNSKEWTENALMTITLSNDSKTNAYNILVSDTGIDFDTTWVDYLSKVNNKWLWSGNQESDIELPQKIVIAQAFTGLTCPNCPFSEAELNAIYQANPNNFIILKYHVGDSLATYSQPTMEASYYGLNSLPTVIFDGQNVLVGASTEILDSYEVIAENMITEEAQVFLDLESYSFVGNTITGNVNISFDNTFDTSNLYLYYVIYEDETTALNAVNEPATKVVRERNRKLLEDLQNNSTIDFSIESDHFTDTDLNLVLWIQRIQDVSNQNLETDKIYNAIKQKIDRGEK